MAPTERPVAGLVGADVPGTGGEVNGRGGICRGPVRRGHGRNCALSKPRRFGQHGARPGQGMSGPEFFDTPQGRRIAFHQTPGRAPGVVFLGGFMSDMEGTKALALEDWARRRGRAFLRFDYSGHGQSSGAFTDGCIGDWAADARAVIDARTEGPQVLVGSSMGGWISAILCREIGERIAAFVGIAAAPDFTEDIDVARFLGR